MTASTTDDQRHCSASRRNDGEARQQARIWKMEGDEACLSRQFIRGLRYYQMALELAENHHLNDLQTRLCRDLAYVYVHHGGAEKALELLDKALSLPANDPEVHLGLLVNRATAQLALHNYHESLATIREAIDYFKEHYPGLVGASMQLVGSCNHLARIERSLKRVVDLLDAGINPERIQISVELARPYWLPPRKS
jgi:tetratricopeptide (TPR) repeat protein